MSLLKAGLVRLVQTQVSKGSWLQGWARGGGVPSMQETCGGAAHAALAGAHAAARQQPRFTPRMAGGDRTGRDIFAAAQQHIRRRELFEFGPQGEAAFD